MLPTGHEGRLDTPHRRHTAPAGQPANPPHRPVSQPTSQPAMSPGGGLAGRCVGDDQLG
jgi:hypothetical protein